VVNLSKKKMYLLPLLSLRLLHALAPLLSCFAALMICTPLAAQTIYAAGDPTAANATSCAGTLTGVFTVNPATGGATSVGTLQVPAAALAVSPTDGLVYYFEAAVANPRLYSWNPSGGVNTLRGTATIPLSAAGSGIIRLAFAPDGRLYAASNDNRIYEINPATGATIRTITPGIPVGGSGDMAFTSNGDLYVVANDTAGTIYQLWRLPAAQVAAGGTQAATQIGTNLGAALNGVAPNGLTEIPPTGACAASPCFALSSGVTNTTYLVNGTTGAASVLGTSGYCLTDLGRGFLANMTISKSNSRTSLQTGDTTVYSVVVTNTGPATVPYMNIQDPGTAGLTCTSVTCAAAGGAVCPATLTIALLQGTGLVTGTMPNASTVTLSVTCTVN
jgi:uncharacterized repeat protein (TIGR01451 family)